MGVKIGGKTITKAAGYEDHLTEAVPAKKIGKQIVGSAMGMTDLQKKHGKEVVLESSDEHVVAQGLMVPLEDMASIHVSGGRTMNLGNFESVKFSASISMPCSKDQLEETYNFCLKWVDEKLQAATEQNKG